MIAHALSMIFFNALVQILIYKAVFLRDPSAVLPFQYSGVVFGLLVDYYYFGEKINLINITGVLLTSIGLISKLLMAWLFIVFVNQLWCCLIVMSIFNYNNKDNKQPFEFMEFFNKYKDLFGVPEVLVLIFRERLFPSKSYR